MHTTGYSEYVRMCRKVSAMASCLFHYVEANLFISATLLLVIQDVHRCTENYNEMLDYDVGYIYGILVH